MGTVKTGNQIHGRGVPGQHQAGGSFASCGVPYVRSHADTASRLDAKCLQTIEIGGAIGGWQGDDLRDRPDQRHDGLIRQKMPFKRTDGLVAVTIIHPQVYQIERLAFTRSVTSMCPGAWVIENAGAARVMAAWGVTPQAQNTGSSPSSIRTPSP